MYRIMMIDEHCEQMIVEHLIEYFQPSFRRILYKIVFLMVLIYF